MDKKHLPIALILALYLIVGTLFAAYTPDWQSPDEPAHYNYVRQLADGRLPIMEPADYDETYRAEIVSAGFAPEYDISVLTYEDWQPPLYYLLLTPIFWLSGGSLLALRLASLLIGGGIVWLGYAIAQKLLPDKPWFAWTTAVFIAFLPQHLSIMASVNNDILAELLIAAILLGLIHNSQSFGPAQDRFTIHNSLLGILLGLGFLTKGTVYPITAVIALALLWQFWGDWQKLVQKGTVVFLPAFLLGALWWGRNIVVYGGLDILGKQAHDAVVVGQIRTADWIAQYGLAEVVQRFITTTFHSFWGQFGWMALPMMNPGWLYPLLWLFTAVALLGLLSSFILHPASFTRRTAILLITFLLALGVHIGYNFTFVQHQGRYLFPAIVPIGLGVAVGLGFWLRPLQRRLPQLPYLLPLGLGLALVSLDLFALFRVIVPNLP